MGIVMQRAIRTEGKMSEYSDDKRFFSERIDELSSSLYHLALRLTRNDSDAKDLVAEAVIKAWSAFATLQDRERFRPWIFRILHNRFISDYRKASIRPREMSWQEDTEHGPEEVVELLVAQSNDFLNWWGNPEKEFVNGLLADEIARAIDSLPEVFREAIVLINVEGLSYDDAAEVLGVPPGTVRSRMRRGRTLLQKMLWQQAKDAGLLPDEVNQETGND